MDPILTRLQTGDLILVNGQANKWYYKLFEYLIKFGTHSNYTHVGMVVRDPDFTEKPLKGLYIWESSWEGTPDPQDNKVKLGVQLTPLETFIKNSKGCKLFLRKLTCPLTIFTKEKLAKVHKEVYDKPYDFMPKDWINALFGKDSQPQKTDRFWCSAFVGYVYTQCGLLSSDTDWSILTPCDFSLDGQTIKLVGGVLENIETLISND